MSDKPEMIMQIKIIKEEGNIKICLFYKYCGISTYAGQRKL
jgi:hypothetical protein